jgi:hypothetical protein
MRSTHEDEEVIGIPDGEEHDVAGSLVPIAIATRTRLYLPRIVQQRRRAARPYVALVSLVDHR